MTKDSVILDHIGEYEEKTVRELSDATGLTVDEVSRELEDLMDQGLITSTPGFAYRLARRSE